MCIAIESDMLRFGLLFLFVGSLEGAVEINETQFAELPPLFGLDDWDQCQRPEDVWCMVDAVLVADGYSPSLELLQEYSKETLKHYNRTQVHRGLCVSRCGAQAEGEAPWADAARTCLQQDLARYNLTAEVLSVSWCSTSRAEPTSGATALAILSVVLVALAFLATTLHILGERCGKTDGNKFLLAFSMKKNWEILTYDRSKPRSDDRMKDLTCIEGIRFVGMQCVIFSHVLLIYIYSYTDNPQFIEKMYDTFGWQAVLNSPLWLQAFFSVSGFLTAYATVISMDKNPITVLKCCTSVVDRFVRLTPVAGVALWFTISWYPLLGTGPQWAWLVTRESHDCSERWWYHILYVHNHLPMGKFCMGHTWYLAADMQLHIVGLVLLFVLCKFRKLIIPVLGALIVASGVASGLVTYFNELTPIITGQAPEVLRTMFLGSKILSLVYLPSWMNLAGYAGGMGTAFLLHHIQCSGVKLNQNKWFNLAFHLSLTLGSAVVLPGVVFLRSSPPLWSAALYSAVDRPLVAVCFNVFLLGCFVKCKYMFALYEVSSGCVVTGEFNLAFHLSLTLGSAVVLPGVVFLRTSPPLWSAALYSAADRPLVAVCFNVFLLGCFVKCKSALRDMFEWRGFHALGRLSYCVFVIHFIVLRLTLAGNTQLNHASIYSLITLLISVSVLSYIAAIPFCLLVELPAIQLWRAIGRDRSERPSPAEQPRDAVKPLDLVANIRRRQDV